MSSSTVGVIALAILLITGAALEFSARRGDGDRATAAQALGAVMRTTPGRVIVLTAWVWLGVHFLAR